MSRNFHTIRALNRIRIPIIVIKLNKLIIFIHSLPFRHAKWSIHEIKEF